MRMLVIAPWSSIAGILMLVGIALFAPDRAAASCGDYLVHGNIGPLTALNASLDHPDAPLSPNDCPTCSKLPSVPIGPVAPVAISVSESLRFALAKQEFAPDPSISIRLAECLFELPFERTIDIFHPPRCISV
jgi:hypothetical protein